MARIRVNFASGVLDAELEGGVTPGTTLESSSLSSLPTITDPDYAVIILDPTGENGDPEIVRVTAYTDGATPSSEATVSRGEEGTEVRTHPVGTAWIHGPTAADFSGEMVNVRSFGATGDGVNDDTAAIAAAVEAATGKILYFPAGTYVTDPISAQTLAGIAGDGWDSVIQLRAQNVSGLGDHAVVEVGGTSGSHVTNFIARDFKIDGNKSNMTGTKSLNMEGLNFKYVDAGRISNVKVVNAISEGFDLDHSTDILILGNVASGCGGNGYHMSNGAISNILIGNIAEDCGKDWERNGFDQYDGSNPAADRNVYIGNVARNNYRNFRILGDNATFRGNTSYGTTTAANAVSAVDAGYEPYVSGGAGTSLQWTNVTQSDDIDLGLPYIRATLTGNWEPDFLNVPSNPTVVDILLLIMVDGTVSITWPNMTAWVTDDGLAPVIEDEEFALIRLTSDSTIGIIASVLGVGSWTPVEAPDFDPWSEAYPTPAHAVWADDPNWLNPGDGQPVSSWRNESGGGHPANTGTARPTFHVSSATYNNHAAVEFTRSSSQNLAVSVTNMSQPHVVVVVGNTGGANSQAERFVGHSGNNDRGFGDNSSNQWGFTGYQGSQGGGTSDSDPHVFVWIVNGSSSALYVDGELVASGMSMFDNEFTWFKLGSGGSTTSTHYLDGYIAYAAVYSKSSRDEDIESLEADLAEYYGITLGGES